MITSLALLFLVSSAAPSGGAAPDAGVKAGAAEVVRAEAAAKPAVEAEAKVVTGGALAADPKLAAEPEIPKAEPPELAAEELNLGWTLVRTLVVLRLVIGLAYLVLNVGLRRLLGIKQAVGANIVTILERVPLDQKRALFVIEAAGEVLLIGGADGNLSLISKLDPAAVEKVRAAAPPSVRVQLSPLVQKLLGRKDPLPPTKP
jgi:flagellar biogenesis protein FliO